MKILKNFKRRGLSINIKQFFIGIAGLSVGTLIYLFDRSPESSWLVHVLLGGASFHEMLPDLFGSLDGSLASYLHTFSFTMISFSFMVQSKKWCLMAAVLWGSVNGLFEIGQLFDSFIVKWIPNCFERLPFLETVDDFFVSGTFDPYDLAAIFAGSSTGYWTGVVTTEKTDTGKNRN
ncbi:conserved hypothetical protein [Desulfamplus magnetovallimortis]|uniref:Uncharacterized protein n=1 Tax=Desulfamplus magnetovallimortis TaxID=1246637 RepID=A0A1W1H9Z4_9BACT|nr:hypothetical protein [Desulfamplus magnetovallimortis]SLM29235.1 conserved hypothetical protein [Desulfamplus magnetovallimortis]